jgi:hypothetical protein
MLLKRFADHVDRCRPEHTSAEPFAFRDRGEYEQAPLPGAPMVADAGKEGAPVSPGLGATADDGLSPVSREQVIDDIIGLVETKRRLVVRPSPREVESWTALVIWLNARRLKLQRTARR